MKALDKFLRAWRTQVALAQAPTVMQAVLDVGCGDGYLLKRLNAARRDGLDPTLPEAQDSAGMRLRQGWFPADLESLGMTGPYDAIFSLAVFEHLDDQAIGAARTCLPGLLKPGGRLIISVPHPFVDRILDVLMFLRLIEGQAVHEHHGFDPAELRALASDGLRLASKTTFQLGLNNLFVFEKV